MKMVEKGSVPILCNVQIGKFRVGCQYGAVLTLRIPVMYSTLKALRTFDMLLQVARMSS